MSPVGLRVDRSSLLDYVRAGRAAVKTIRASVRRIINAGRREARQRIAAEFTPRTGFLRRQSRRMQTKVDVKSYEIKGRVTPIPRIMNIFEGGARLSNGRGFLRARPVVAPARRVLEKQAPEAIQKILADLAREANR
jgi:hypothetical protein